MRPRHTRPMYSSILLAGTLPFTLTPPLLADDLPLTLSNPSSTSLPAWPAPTPVLATSDGQVTPAIDFGPPADQRVPSTLDGVTFTASKYLYGSNVTILNSLTFANASFISYIAKSQFDTPVAAGTINIPGVQTLAGTGSIDFNGGSGGGGPATINAGTLTIGIGVSINCHGDPDGNFSNVVVQADTLFNFGTLERVEF